MKLNVAISKIGDSCFYEPSLAAYPEKISLYIAPHLRCLFYNHPNIDLVTEWQTDGVVLDDYGCNQWAQRNGKYLSCGYFHALGLDALIDDSSVRKTYKAFGLNDCGYGDYICIAPFSQGIITHNVAASLDWWDSLIQRIEAPVIALGGSGEPLLPRCANLRGLDLRALLAILGASQGILTIETGILPLSTAVNRPVIALNCATHPSLTVPNLERFAFIRHENTAWNQDLVLNLMKSHFIS